MCVERGVGKGGEENLDDFDSKSMDNFFHVGCMGDKFGEMKICIQKKKKKKNLLELVGI